MSDHSPESERSYTSEDVEISTSGSGSDFIIVTESLAFDNAHGSGKIELKLKLEKYAELLCVRRVTGTIYLHADERDDKLQIGNLIANIVDRTALNARGTPAYLDEMLRPGTRYDKDVFDCFAKMYDASGQTLPALAAQSEAVQADQVVFIEELELHRRFHSRGYGEIALRIFHHALMNLPDGYAFNGTVLLKPYSMNAGPVPTQDPYEVEGRLLRFYRKCGYEVWYEEEGREIGKRIMGRTLPPWL
ncbi:hypothetical protein B0A54_05134 [Friedmanniomyces endolithicus]|uniref:N-acetyltransferase domain-containing protein n=1 Tax=Friedmanniomyces endolithicus TaxID=329885 RepID=A0A4U0V6I4_9PEZI|nr:hypothetical protein LTS09_003612 [Friedmanniomyces endolithicus]TKA44390.1 hypothetical protein B0A54_05134 [Friedmanniomyces endolithicus]